MLVILVLCGGMFSLAAAAIVMYLIAQKAKGTHEGLPADLHKHGDFYVTWYSYQDNTPCNSSDSSSGNKLIPFVSVAVPFTQLKKWGGPLDYGQWLFVESLKGNDMPNGTKHTGWVKIDDFCGDQNNDGYCYKKDGLPSIDLYVGDREQSNQTCSGGPAGSGLDLSAVYTGTPPESQRILNYGGAEKGSGKRKDCKDKISCK